MSWPLNRWFENWVLMSDIVWSPIKLWIYVSSIHQVHVLKFFRGYARTAPSSRLSVANGRQEDQKQFTFQPKCLQCPKQRLSRLLSWLSSPFLLPGGSLKCTCLHNSPSGAMLPQLTSEAPDCTSWRVSQCLSSNAHAHRWCIWHSISHSYTTKRLRQRLVRVMLIFFQEVQIYSKVAS